MQRKNSHKGDRVNEEVRRELSDIISHELKDPRVSGMTSITLAQVTRDLKYCKAFVSVLGSEEESKATMEGLESAKGFVRKELAARLNLRNTPEITFVADHSISYGIEMSKRIDEVLEEERENESADQQD